MSTGTYLSTSQKSSGISQNHVHLICRNGIYYFSSRVPSDLQTRFNKERVTISLQTRSFNKAEKSAGSLSDRLERYWEGLRLEMFHTKELGLTKVTPIKSNQKDQVVSIDAAVETYLRLKGDGQLTLHFY